MIIDEVPINLSNLLIGHGSDPISLVNLNINIEDELALLEQTQSLPDSQIS